MVPTSPVVFPATFLASPELAALARSVGYTVLILVTEDGAMGLALPIREDQEVHKAIAFSGGVEGIKMVEASIRYALAPLTSARVLS